MIGQITPSIRTTIPDGYIECNGQTITRQDYPKFFEWLGTTADTYAVPALNSDYTTLGHAGTSSFSFRAHENGRNNIKYPPSIQSHTHSQSDEIDITRQDHESQGDVYTAGQTVYGWIETPTARIVSFGDTVTVRDNSICVRYLIGVE